MPKFAAIDNDFLNHLVDIKDQRDAYELILRFFTAMDFTVVMHPLVRLHEKNPYSNALEDRLFDEGVIIVPELSDIWTSKPGGKPFYETMVKQLYFRFTGQKYPCNDVCAEWKKQHSLGEIHSAAMCIFMEYNYLLTDDKDAVKNLGAAVTRATQSSVNVLNREMCCNILKAAGVLNHNERKRLSYKRV